MTLSGNWANTQILPTVYQANGIGFADWISIFTLCTAPVIAHIIGGVPPSSIISERKMRWHDRIGHYNPTSILWRYAAITDRRIRAKDWSPQDMAGSNAVFWTDDGWDGSEKMLYEAMAHCIYLPRRAILELLSSGSLKTAIIGLQGAQALVTTFQDLSMSTSSDPTAADSLFYFIAIVGLLRVCCCLWLTDDYLYTISHGHVDTGLADNTLTHKEENPADIVLLKRNPWGARRISQDSLMDTSADHQSLPAQNLPTHSRFRPSSFWGSRLFRFFFWSPLATFWALHFVFSLPWTAPIVATSTEFLLVIFYTFFLTATVGIYAWYFIRTGTETTIIPCISSVWYKIYTLCLAGLGLIVLIIACMETRRTWCGRYTTWTYPTGDISACGSLPG
ncbi:hypothetical protein BX600DRAFT_475582 [Xylariales sp. PMI_506]|nr:hypothetical protein BX600DRAFT_475582 [Xylariales sp. PMI_506]